MEGKRIGAFLQSAKRRFLARTLRMLLINIACCKSTYWIEGKIGLRKVESKMWRHHVPGTIFRADTYQAHIRTTLHRQQELKADLATTGQHPEDAQDLLQGQGMQEAHPAQGHPVQGWQGAHPPNLDHPTPKHDKLTSHPKRPPSSRRVSVVTTVSSPVTVVRPSPSSTRRPRPPRRSSSD